MHGDRGPSQDRVHVSSQTIHSIINFDDSHLQRQRSTPNYISTAVLNSAIAAIAVIAA
jgi:hypothetical protein